MTGSPKLLRAALLFAALALAYFTAANAYAFCRTTTCDDAVEQCTVGSDGCFTSGLPLFWPDACVTFGVNKNGSTLRGITFDEANAVASRAFQNWISADCGGQHPSIGIVPFGEIECDLAEFNNDPPGPNANLIVFRDDGWQYDDGNSTIALATITFDADTGEILDADVEINSFRIELTTSNENVKSDLQSVLTHEAGHFLGLAHSSDKTASMSASYDRGDLSFRTLSRDDQNAICSVYPPTFDIGDCRGAQPKHGFSRYCGEPYSRPDGCGVVPVGQPARAPGVWLVLGALGLAAALRRRSA